jgi:predicted MFS family arabinose efflux permease
MSSRWLGLAALTLARAGMGFQFQSVAAVSPFISSALGLDKTQLGWLIGLYLLPGIAFALPGGLLGRRFGDKRLVLVGLLLMAAGGLWLAVAGSLFEASAARVVSGAGAVMLNVLMTKMVADAFDGKERLLAMSILINAWPIGIGLALLVVGPISQAAGWSMGIASSSVLAAIGFLLVLTVYRAPAQTATESVEGLGLGTMSQAEWKLLIVASLPWLLYNAAFQIEMSFLPSWLLERGLGVAGTGSLVALNAVLFVVGVQVGGIVLKRARRPDLVCHVGVSAWCVTLLALTTPTPPLPWIVVGGLLGGLPAAAFVSLPAECLRPSSRSAGMGVFYTAYYLGCATLPTLAGALYDHSGGAAALAMASALAVFALPVLWWFHRSIARSPHAVRV